MAQLVHLKSLLSNHDILIQIALGANELSHNDLKRVQFKQILFTNLQITFQYMWLDK